APPRKPVPVSPVPKKAPSPRPQASAAAAESPTPTKAKGVEKAADKAEKVTVEAVNEAPVATAGPRPPPSGATAHAVPSRAGQPAAGADSDDFEAAEPGSLLAGPRNVKPYIAKRGEQYMNKEQLEHFRQILSGWKRDLMVEVDRTVSHMKDEA